MTKMKKLSNCPRCGSVYLSIKHRSENGHMTVLCEDCNHEFNAIGKPPKKHDKQRGANRDRL